MGPQMMSSTDWLEFKERRIKLTSRQGIITRHVVWENIPRKIKRPLEPENESWDFGSVTDKYCPLK